jgi:hypothetical protein
MRYFLVCFNNGYSNGNKFCCDNKFVSISEIESDLNCTVTFVFEFQSEEDFLSAQNELA